MFCVLYRSLHLVGTGKGFQKQNRCHSKFCLCIRSCEVYTETQSTVKRDEGKTKLAVIIQAQVSQCYLSISDKETEQHGATRQ